ncbi:DMT family transporter [Rhizobium sp. KVB221]|uniref:DMT family transporter n=1 Tax=Rhizobium setariae TaxID=2801340 RepID=A0A937CP31_9HYPH|nr:DMT family transporter [Rhizobium setariae]MBL0371948.1 DMT family transporter [Rhizobium setariae]
MTRIQANLILLATAAIWGAGFVAQDMAMETMGPLWFVGLRFLVAFMVALPLALREHSRVTAPVNHREMLIFVVIGLALFGGATTQQFGLLTTSVTNSSFLTGLYVIIVPVLSVIVLRKIPHWIIWPAAIMAVTGIYYLSGGELASLTTGDLLTIVCACFWATQVLLIGVFAPGSERPMALSAIQFLVCGLGGIVLAIVFEPITWQGFVGAIPEILYAGLFSSGIAFILQIIGQRWTTAPQAAIFLASESLFGALFGAALLGERMGLLGYVGCALLFTSMILVEIVPEMAKSKYRRA